MSKLPRHGMSRVLAALLTFSGLASASSYSASEREGAPASDAGKPGVLHISVLVRELDGSPIAYLRGKDFRVELGGVRVPVSVTRPAVHAKKPSAAEVTRVLILISPRFGSAGAGASVEALLQKLPANFHGAALSIVEPDGTATRYYRTRDRLARNLHNGGTIRESYADAFARLGTRVGRRAVVYVGSRGERTPNVIRWEAARVGAMIYEVGGDVYDNYVYGGEGSGPPGPPSYGGGWYGAAAAPENGMPSVGFDFSVPIFTKTIRDVLVERSVRGALHDLATDNEGFYDLEARVPNDAKSLALGVGMGEDYQVSAQAYRLDGGPVPELSLEGGKE